jgi:anti-sigma factor RsiW
LAKELERFTNYGERRRNRPQLVAACVAALVLIGAAGLGWHYLSSDVTGQRMFALFDQRMPAPGTAERQSERQQAAGEQQGATQQPAAASRGEQSAGEQQTAKREQGPAPTASAPDFSSFGFDLIGTRLLAGHDDRSMQLIYESSVGARVELFYTSGSESSKSSLTLMEEGPIAVLFWHNAGRSYSLIGEVDRDTLLEIGKVVNGEWTVPVPARKEPAEGEKNRSSNENVGATPAAGSDPAAKAQDGQDGQDDFGVTPLEDGTITPEELMPADLEMEEQT